MSEFGDLIDRKIYFFNGRKQFVGIVQGVDRKIGISIVDADNLDEQLLCISPKIHAKQVFNGGIRFDLSYNEMFDNIVDSIKSGYINARIMLSWTEPCIVLFNRGNMATCPFKGGK